ncbi:hypothetical protein D9M68_992850 [compost metagenome]
MKFETAVRPTRDQYGRIENKQVIVALVRDEPAARQPQARQTTAPADAGKTN